MTQMSPQSQTDLRFFPASMDKTARLLTSEQIHHFNARGYLCGLPVFNAAQTEQNRQHFDRLLAQSLALGMDTYSMKHFERACRCLYDLVTNPVLLDAVEDILGPDILCWGSHCFCKPPGDSQQVAWHQDAVYWSLTPSKTVTAWVAIDDVDEGNGAMRVVPGSHLNGPLPLRVSEPSERNVLWLTFDGVEDHDGPVTMTQRAGEVSLHSDLLLHDSPPNASHRRRCGLAIRYCSPDVRLMDGGERGAVICRGTDPSGHWARVPRPETNDILATDVPIGRRVSRPVSDFPRAIQS